MDNIDKTWHLAKDQDEVRVTEFELQLWRVFYGFVRWQEECEKCISGNDLTGNELAILHIIRMRNKPKTITDVGRLLNRDDIHNIRYSISKLLKMGLIQKVKGHHNNKNFFLQITEQGIKNTDAYTRIRKSILIKMFGQDPELKLEEITKAFVKIKSIYDEADRAVASYSHSEEFPL